MAGEKKKTRIDVQSLPQERREIIQFLQKLKFRKKAIGGVSEIDVWKKIAELDRLYAEALKAERIRYDTKLDGYRKEAGRQILKWKNAYEKQKNGEA